MSSLLMPMMTKVFGSWRTGLLAAAATLAVVATSLNVHAAAAAATAADDDDNDDVVVTIFENAAIEWEPSITEPAKRGDHVVASEGHLVERTIQLPPAPDTQLKVKRIIATLTVEPAIVAEGENKVRPGDPWTRLGSVSVVMPGADMQPPQGKTSDSGQASAISPASRAVSQLPPAGEVELMRFITGYGGSGVFTQDVTALAPLLHDRTTLRVFISTYKKPAWKVTLTLTYSDKGIGHRNPAWVMPVFFEEELTADRNRIRTVIDVPEGLTTPRLHVISTGHATDGSGGDEFITRSHILRIDNTEIARWRPWAESGGALRPLNPASGRMTINNGRNDTGREIWSSDLDRSGWHPGTVVDPLRIPIPELTPGRHTIELEIRDIRPKTVNAEGEEHYGYWRTTAVVVADTPWP